MFMCLVETQPDLSQQISRIEYRIINYCHHAVYQIIRTYSFYICKFVPFKHVSEAEAEGPRFYWALLSDCCRAHGSWGLLCLISGLTRAPSQHPSRV